MAIVLPGGTPPSETQDPDQWQDLTPRQIVEALDRYIIGQADAKRAVAIALRNRYRRQQLPPEIAEEVYPKNILMIGATGVGKTEIARRLAKLDRSPFLKIEASKFTEVGYVGRDVESMIRDLTDLAVSQIRDEKMAEVAERAARNAENRLLDLLLPAPRRQTLSEEADLERQRFEQTREKLRAQLRDGHLEDREVTLELQPRVVSTVGLFTPGGTEEVDINLKELMPQLFQGRTKKTRMKVAEAREVLQREEAERLVEMDRVAALAVDRVEQRGMIFLDEIDKVAGREGGHGPDVSREGVQRDLLPIIEGTTVNTKYGLVRTDHILFIAAGAFHVSKPADLIPELQGRFPIRVEMDTLGRAEFIRILTEPQNSLIRQYQALLATEGVELTLTPDAVEAVADFAVRVNDQTENIGARRLLTLLEKVLEEISFQAPELAERQQKIDAAFVEERLKEIAEDRDLSKYIL